jgi:FeoB-associated Cys-rich membrane protein
MSPQFQTIAALVIVALAATWLIARALRKRRNPGCGGDCGCPASAIKPKPRT